MTSPDGPQDQPSGESLRGRQESSGSTPAPPPDDTSTSIIRRDPTGPIPEPLSDDTRTSIIRRHPIEMPTDEDDAPTSIVRAAPRSTARPAPQRIEGTPRPPSNTTAIAASTVSILSGWATSVVATDLITGWWQTDRLFCVGVGFLTAVFGASTIAGVVGMLLRRRVGIYLSLVAAILGLLIFVGIYVTGAHAAGIVHAIPVLPLATIALAVAPGTRRWTA